MHRVAPLTGEAALGATAGGPGLVVSVRAMGYRPSRLVDAMQSCIGSCRNASQSLWLGGVLAFYAVSWSSLRHMNVRGYGGATSPSGDVEIAWCGRTDRWRRWRLLVNDKIIDHGRGDRSLVAALFEASSRGDRYGAVAASECRAFAVLNDV